MKYKVPIIAVFVLILGVGTGLVIGKAFETEKSDMAEAPTQETLKIPSDEEVEITVRVDKSEKEISDLLYEERLDSIPEVENSDNYQQMIKNVQDADLLPQKIDTEDVVDNKNGIEQIETTLESKVERHLAAWEKEAIPFDDASIANEPIISIIIDDVGVAQAWSKKAIALPAPMTMSIIPYGRNLKQHVDSSKANGHEVMLHIPMEPGNPDVDPGENALTTDMNMVELVDNLLWNLEQFDGYIGVNNHMGSKFTAWGEGMRVVMSELKQRELIFIDSVTSADSVGFKMAREMSIPTAVRDIFLDHDMSEEAIWAQLERTEARALKNGHVVAIGHPHKNTIKVLTEWAATIEERGFKLVPASVIIRKLNKIDPVRTSSLAQ